ncbi:MAG TPA: Uma2 family endonuclease [Gemmataceae bacterium]|nr:Uma2 family endonuclease [Gemmataceae bacterium]
MATASSTPIPWKNGYPTSDGKPMAETDWHRDLMNALIQTLKVWYASQSRVYVSGNLLLYYEQGNRRRHVSPDVFVVKGIANHDRPNYLLWEEGKGPDVAIELTSSSTRREDVEDKYHLYQDTLRVKEYFLFDPLGDYLTPSLQGHRLRRGQYYPIRVVAGRLPSQVLRLHLERHGRELRLFDPAASRWLPTPLEMAGEAEAAQRQAEAAQRQTEAENERLRRELADLRQRLANNQDTAS